MQGRKMNQLSLRNFYVTFQSKISKSDNTFLSCSYKYRFPFQRDTAYKLPISVDSEVDCAELAVANGEVGVDDRHPRFSVYCVKPEALNVLTVSLIFVCTTQTSEETSTATHGYISKQRFRQSVRVINGYNIPYSDATPRCFVHVSHPVKHAQDT